MKKQPDIVQVKKGAVTFGLLLMVIGYGLLWYCFNWKLPLGILLMICGNNSLQIFKTPNNLENRMRRATLLVDLTDINNVINHKTEDNDTDTNIHS